MLKKDVTVPGRYIAKVGNTLTIVHITGTHRYGGYSAINERSQRVVRIKSAAKLRRPVADDFTVEIWDMRVQVRNAGDKAMFDDAKSTSNDVENLVA